ncbi:envelope glycoprotein H [Leporid alphaherpesvirus 4]|uniref:Envelope glycoprotein H n=1 Tax=Leporid alphaherpesvirus 4 TaxID=481315 RepID=J9QWL1_9ALPH|nr:envelope glycoprotein H [Leporid alphaherpesvirus 4]AFR32464.1 envelope glycoprotein H [Leporid alphaherpesvirus 4]
MPRGRFVGALALPGLVLALAITAEIARADGAASRRRSLDPWFYYEHLNYAGKYWQEDGGRRIWLPSVPSASGNSLSSFAPPAEANITTANIPLLQWRVNGSCFIMITYPEFPQDRGLLLFVPHEYLVSDGPTPATPPPRRPPRSVAEAGPPLRPILGLQKNPAGAMLLGSRYLSAYAPISDYGALRVPRGPNTATADRPHGALYVPMSSPGKKAARLRLSNVRAGNMRNSSRTWLDHKHVFRAAEPHVYRSPSAAAWPLEISTTGELSFGCDAALVRVRYGREFMGLVLSMKNATPAELLVVPAKEHMHSTDPDATQLPGPSAGPRYRVFIISDVDGARDAELVRALADIAAYPEESRNYVQHISRAYAEFFKHARGDGPLFAASAQLFWRMSGLMAAAGFSLLDAAREHGAVSLTNLVRFRTHVRMLAELASRGAAGCSTGTAFSRVDIWARDAQIDQNLARLAREALGAAEHSLAGAAQAYELLYAAGPNHTDATLEAGASATVSDIYLGFLRGAGVGTRAARRALFFAAAILLGPLERGEFSDTQLEQARTLLLHMTAMCTSDTAAESNAYIRTALDEADHTKRLFLAPDHFSPCAASLRFDLTEMPFVLDALAQTADTSVPAEVVEARTRAVAAALTRWAYRDAVLAAVLPRDAGGCASRVSGRSILMVLPISKDAAFAVSYISLGIGLEYMLEGVDVRRPLHLTYITSECQRRPASIEARRLAYRDTDTDMGLAGSVFMRYTPAGEIASALVIDTGEAQERLIHGPVGDAGDVFSSSVPSTALLLFPNGTVINLLAFDTVLRPSVPTEYLVVSGVGVLLIAASLAGMGRVAWVCARHFK